MKESLIAALAGALLALVSTAAGAEDWDILIRGATVIDGTGEPGFVADVAIKNGRIAFVGDAQEGDAATVIDAEGLTLTPGFIDVHNHVSGIVGRGGRSGPIDFTNSAYLTQGVTTIVSGPDGGSSPARIREVLAFFEEHGFGTNYAWYVGHNGIREQVMGHARRKPTEDELERMKALVREGMDMGAVGLSTGLMYDPGMFSTTAEVIALAAEVAHYGGVYDSHTRDPVMALIDSYAEAIEIGKAAGIPAKIGHAKAVGLRNAGRMRDVVALVEEARASGLNVVTDQYPYDGAATATLAEIIILPDGAGSESMPRRRAMVQEALKDPETRAEARELSENGRNGGFSWVKAVGYGSMRIVDAPGNPDLVGENLELLARRREQDPFALVTELILQADEPILLTLGAMAEADVRTLLVQPWNMICSDGGYVYGDDTMSGHPRSTGTFTRVLGYYVREEGVLTLPEAVRKMTSLPADYLHFHDRGRIEVGKVADIAVFDADTVAARSTWTDPNALSIGMVHVLVNGIPVIRAGEVTGALPGKFVKHQSQASTADVARYEFDPAWPKLPLPNNWALGQLAGIAVDAEDNIWILQRPRTLYPWERAAAEEPPVADCCVPAPPVVQFDPSGKVLRAWGGPGESYDWPASEHGLYIDYRGNIWIGGNRTARPGRDQESTVDGMVLKFSPDGEFLLQIGEAGPSKGSRDTTQLAGAADVAVYPPTNEVFVADGYGNNRVIVFDAGTGEFKRMWGAYGEPPTDEQLSPYDPSAPPPKQFRTVHCIEVSADGFVYVCDRDNNRVQVFRVDGTFVTEWFYRKDTLTGPGRGPGTVLDIAFSQDPGQRTMLVADAPNSEVLFVRRADGEIIGSFGHYGNFAGQLNRLHQLAMDSKGNIYTAEATGKRIQKFVRKAL